MVSFLIRTAKASDRDTLVSLAKTFDLLNLPSQKPLLEEKMQTSLLSFQGEIPPHQAEYIFVLEDLTHKKVIGTSSIIGQHGTFEKPYYYLKLLSKTLKFGSQKKEHLMLRFCCNCQGSTSIGGLVLHHSYRGHSKKLGRQISLARFLYMAFFPRRFSEKMHCEFAPCLHPDGSSAFWDSFGSYFTGLSYNEILKRNYGEVIKHLFPKEDIYLSFLSLEAQKVLGRVSPQTISAKKMLESICFRPLNEFHPLDGGPHYGANRKDLKPFKEGRFASLQEEDFSYKGSGSGGKRGEEAKGDDDSGDGDSGGDGDGDRVSSSSQTQSSPGPSEALVGTMGEEGFRACVCFYSSRVQSDGSLGIVLPSEAKRVLKVSPNATLFYYSLT